MKITGVEYFTRKSRMNRKKLAAMAGISPSTFTRMCSGEGIMQRSVLLYARVAEVFGVEIAQLLETYDDSELGVGNKAAYPCRTANLDNCVAVYRQRQGLTLAQLGARLGGKTRACAQLACAEETPRKKHIKVLAAYEGITPEEFCRIYAPEV